MNISRVIGCLGAGCLIWAAAASGATINVPGDQPTIQDGINAAVSGVDEVVVADGTYSENIDFSGKAITVRSVNGPAVTIIDGVGFDSAVKCTTGETAATALNGSTITGGNAAVGGGMDNNGSSPTVINCVFAGNSVSFNGGAMRNLNASPTLINCAFSGNTANGSGGGMYNADGTPALTNCILWGNTDDADGGAGGPFTDESAQIHVNAGTVTVNYSNVQGTWTGTGSNNIDDDPLFVDADGVDNTVGTVDDDLRLSAGSPCIDAADLAVYGANGGPFDDLGGLDRDVDDPSTANTGAGALTFLDMGAYEYQATPTTGSQADFDNDGDVDGIDFLTFSVCYNGSLKPPACP